ncbi:Cof-type HAD-IIB family hydrolase [Lacticigenium naphthae]|uniref:Cof-type HAD-IIB family hydrolase n=1 Tax=Lacticigenium naphthae TaxID=515351 RepID=UPI000407A096|nr:Cof-type HAD-IIB family hydrolase [Lacticigenium naphthae]
MIKLVALDLDGTLLNEKKIVSEKNKKAIGMLKEKGIHVILCTGRPLLGMKHLLEELDLNNPGNYAITYNGGLVQETHTGGTIYSKSFQFEEVEDIYQMSQTIGVPCNFIDLEKVYEPSYPEGRPSMYPEIMNILPFEKINGKNTPDAEINKIVFCTPQYHLDNAIEKIPQSYFEKYTLMKSRPILLEVLPKDVDKGNGIAKLVEILGIQQSEVMAIGDQENDLAMIEYAGIGVAMGNAIDSVKRAAQYITEDYQNDGVAVAINKFTKE